jgi:hypothetical protein
MASCDPSRGLLRAGPSSFHSPHVSSGNYERAGRWAHALQYSPEVGNARGENTASSPPFCFSSSCATSASQSPWIWVLDVRKDAPLSLGNECYPSSGLVVRTDRGHCRSALFRLETSVLRARLCLHPVSSSCHLAHPSPLVGSEGHENANWASPRPGVPWCFYQYRLRSRASRASF